MYIWVQQQTKLILNKSLVKKWANLQLLTYSQFYLQTVPNNNVFYNTVLNAFEKSSKHKASVTQWTVYFEDDVAGGNHFHIALKLSSTRRWHPIFAYLCNENDIAVNIFSKKLWLLWSIQICMQRKLISACFTRTRSPN